MNVAFMFGEERMAPRALTDLPAGARGRLLAIEVDDEGDLQRLEVMGLCAGRLVEVVKSGDPIIVSVLGTRIGLARCLAQSATVEAETA